MKDPRYQNDFSDYSDYPQDGYGRLNLDYRFPEPIDNDDDEGIEDLENENDEL